MRIFFKNPKNQEKLQTNLMNGFREKFKGVDFGPKNDPFPHFGHQKKFFSKKSSVTFLCLSNPDFTQKIRKKVMGQS